MFVADDFPETQVVTDVMPKSGHPRLVHTAHPAYRANEGPPWAWGGVTSAGSPARKRGEMAQPVVHFDAIGKDGERLRRATSMNSAGSPGLCCMRSTIDKEDQP